MAVNEDRKLSFLYQDKTADGKESHFFKFIERTDGEVTRPFRSTTGLTGFL
jgi:hypothetical protein